MAWIISAPRLSRLRPVVCRGKSTQRPGVWSESNERVSAHETARVDVTSRDSQEHVEITHRMMMKSPRHENRLGTIRGLE